MIIQRSYLNPATPNMSKMIQLENYAHTNNRILENPTLDLTQSYVKPILRQFVDQMPRET